MSRGLRNNNPGNIRISGTLYRGEVNPSTDKAFKQFETMAWGYRAMFVLLYTYQKRYGCNTVRDIINRYAPPCENNTQGYITRVCRDAGIDADVVITATDEKTMILVVAAMSAVENGVTAVEEDVRRGWELFLKHRP